MKKMLGLLVVGFVALALSARADSYLVSMTVTQGQAITYSDPIPVSGELEKIEVYQTNPGTATVTIATYDGTTAVDTFASLASLSTSTKLVRPVFLPTDNTGTALAAAGGGALTTNYTQVLNVLYKPAMLGGNIKMAVTAGACSLTAHTVEARIFYRPVAK